jgi:hypothetical protein
MRAPDLAEQQFIGRGLPAKSAGARAEIHADNPRVGDEKMETNSMRKLFSGLVVAAAVALSAPVVGMPVVSQIGSAVVESGDGMIQQVADGCGRGWHRGPGGRCRPNRAAVVVTPGIPLVAPLVVVPRAAWCHRPATSRNFRC